jgi:serine/threonine protein kinase
MQEEQIIGQGQYGTVYRRILKGKPRAVKKIGIFSQEINDEYEHEVKMLKRVRGSDFVCNYRNSFINPPWGVIVMACYSMELYHKIRLNEIDANARKRYMLQVAKGLRHLKQRNVLHRDLSSMNIMLDENDIVKICDFGMSISYVKGNAEETYVCTLAYRAVELLLGECVYDFAIDVWAFGCLYLEFIHRDYFIDEQDETDQLRVIAEKIGVPPKPGAATEYKLQPIENIEESEWNLIRGTVDPCVKSRTQIEDVVMLMENVSKQQ